MDFPQSSFFPCSTTPYSPTRANGTHKPAFLKESDPPRAPGTSHGSAPSSTLVSDTVSSSGDSSACEISKPEPSREQSSGVSPETFGIVMCALEGSMPPASCEESNVSSSEAHDPQVSNHSETPGLKTAHSGKELAQRSIPLEQETQIYTQPPNRSVPKRKSSSRTEELPLKASKDKEVQLDDGNSWIYILCAYSSFLLIVAFLYWCLGDFANTSLTYILIIGLTAFRIHRDLASGIFGALLTLGAIIWQSYSISCSSRPDGLSARSIFDRCHQLSPSDSHLPDRISLSIKILNLLTVVGLFTLICIVMNRSKECTLGRLKSKIARAVSNDPLDSGSRSYLSYLNDGSRAATFLTYTAWICLGILLGLSIVSYLNGSNGLAVVLLLMIVSNCMYLILGARGIVEAGRVRSYRNTLLVIMVGLTISVVIMCCFIVAGTHSSLSVVEITEPIASKHGRFLQSQNVREGVTTISEPLGFLLPSKITHDLSVLQLLFCLCLSVVISRIEVGYRWGEKYPIVRDSPSADKYEDRFPRFNDNPSNNSQSFHETFDMSAISEYSVFENTLGDSPTKENATITGSFEQSKHFQNSVSQICQSFSDLRYWRANEDGWGYLILRYIALLIERCLISYVNHCISKINQYTREDYLTQSAFLSRTKAYFAASELTRPAPITVNRIATPDIHLTQYSADDRQDPTLKFATISESTAVLPERISRHESVENCSLTCFEPSHGDKLEGLNGSTTNFGSTNFATEFLDAGFASTVFLQQFSDEVIRTLADKPSSAFAEAESQSVEVGEREVWLGGGGVSVVSLTSEARSVDLTTAERESEDVWKKSILVHDGGRKISRRGINFSVVPRWSARTARSLRRKEANRFDMLRDARRYSIWSGNGNREVASLDATVTKTAALLRCGTGPVKQVGGCVERGYSGEDWVPESVKVRRVGGKKHARKGVPTEIRGDDFSDSNNFLKSKTRLHCDQRDAKKACFAGNLERIAGDCNTPISSTASIIHYTTSRSSESMDWLGRVKSPSSPFPRIGSTRGVDKNRRKTNESVDHAKVGVASASSKKGSSGLDRKSRHGKKTAPRIRRVLIDNEWQPEKFRAVVAAGLHSSACDVSCESDHSAGQITPIESRATDDRGIVEARGASGGIKARVTTQSGECHCSAVNSVRGEKGVLRGGSEPGEGSGGYGRKEAKRREKEEDEKGAEREGRQDERSSISSEGNSSGGNSGGSSGDDGGEDSEENSDDSDDDSSENTDEDEEEENYKKKKKKELEMKDKPHGNEISINSVESGMYTGGTAGDLNGSDFYTASILSEKSHNDSGVFKDLQNSVLNSSVEVTPRNQGQVNDDQEASEGDNESDNYVRIDDAQLRDAEQLGDAEKQRDGEQLGDTEEQSDDGQLSDAEEQSGEEKLTDAKKQSDEEQLSDAKKPGGDEQISNAEKEGGDEQLGDAKKQRDDEQPGDDAKLNRVEEGSSDSELSDGAGISDDDELVTDEEEEDAAKGKDDKEVLLEQVIEEGTGLGGEKEKNTTNEEDEKREENPYLEENGNYEKSALQERDGKQDENPPMQQTGNNEAYGPQENDEDPEENAPIVVNENDEKYVSADKHVKHAENAPIKGNGNDEKDATQENDEGHAEDFSRKESGNHEEPKPQQKQDDDEQNAPIEENGNNRTKVQSRMHEEHVENPLIKQNENDEENHPREKGESRTENLFSPFSENESDKKHHPDQRRETDEENPHPEQDGHNGEYAPQQKYNSHVEDPPIEENGNNGKNSPFKDKGNKRIPLLEKNGIIRNITPDEKDEAEVNSRLEENEGKFGGLDQYGQSDENLALTVNDEKYARPQESSEQKLALEGREREFPLKEDLRNEKNPDLEEEEQVGSSPCEIRCEGKGAVEDESDEKESEGLSSSEDASSPFFEMGNFSVGNTSASSCWDEEAGRRVALLHSRHLTAESHDVSSLSGMGEKGGKKDLIKDYLSKGDKMCVGAYSDLLRDVEVNHVRVAQTGESCVKKSEPKGRMVQSGGWSTESVQERSGEKQAIADQVASGEATPEGETERKQNTEEQIVRQMKLEETKSNEVGDHGSQAILNVEPIRNVLSSVGGGRVWIRKRGIARMCLRAERRLKMLWSKELRARICPKDGIL